ncbi:MAG: hypothetical protein ABWZ77_05950 [Naasia sp.]
MNAVGTALDRLTGRVPMYRLVSLSLLATLVLAVVLSAAGQLFYSPGALLASAAVAVVSTWVVSRLLGLAFDVPVHGESSVITGLIVFFLMLPTLDPLGLAIIGLVGLVAAASKFLIAWRGRHLVNPAAFGAFAVALTGLGAAGWWVATAGLLPLVALAAVLILWRTRTHVVGLVFMGLATLLVTVGLIGYGEEPLVALQTALFSYPIVFLGAFMLTEPLTLPARRWQQLVVAAVIAVVFALPLFVQLSFGNFYISQEFAVLVGNLVGVALAFPVAARLRYVGSRRIGPDAVEYRFTPARTLRPHRPGQYAELHLAHSGTDRRGPRRHLSVVSPRGSDELAFAVRIPQDRSSSFKRALGELEPGAPARATWVGGDFVLPDDRALPVLFVAGGIGITPFVGDLEAGARNALLVYRAASEADLLYRDEIEASGLPVIAVTPEEPGRMAERWRWAPDLESALALVPDAAQRSAYVSGTPSFVTRSRSALRRAGVRKIRTDRFAGY